MLKRVLHTGIAVPGLPAALELYRSFGFETVKEFRKPDLDADVAMVAKDGATLELFQFNDPDHPQVRFIRNHIALYSDALEEDVQQLIEQGYKLTIPITEGVVFRYAFLQDAAGTNYEIATDKT